MASGDWLDLSEHACRAAQLDPSDTTGDLVQAKAKINEGYLSVCHTGDPWDFMEKEGQWDTVAGSDKYTFSSIATAMSISGASIREIHRVLDDDNGFLLEGMSWAHLEGFTWSVQDNEPRGRPTSYATWGSQGAAVIRLFPNPDAAYTMGTFVSLAAEEMDVNTETPIIPLAWRHRLLVPYAAWKLLSQEGGTEARGAARDYRDEYLEAFREMRTAHATAKRPTFKVMQPGFYERESSVVGEWHWWT